MKQIIEYFGGAIIAVLVGSCVMGLFSELPVKLEKIAERSLTMVGAEFGGNQAFIECQNMPKWKLFVKENYDIKTGISYDVGDFVTITDPGGEVQNVWFSAGWYEGASEVQMLITDGGRCFSCTHPGVYLVTVGGYSSSGEYYETQIRVLVNGEVTV